MCLEWPDCITSHRGSKWKARETRREGGVGGGIVVFVSEEIWHSHYLFSLALAFFSNLVFPNRPTRGRPASEPLKSLLAEEQRRSKLSGCAVELMGGPCCYPRRQQGTDTPADTRPLRRGMHTLVHRFTVATEGMRAASAAMEL